MKSFISALLVLFAISLHAASGTTYLACPSGQTQVGDACVAADLGSCTPDTASQSSTIDPPSLVSERILSSVNIELTTTQALVSNRVVTAITLSNNALCNYPGPSWVKTVDSTGCTDLYSFTLPWSEAYLNTSSDQADDACGLTRDNSNPDFLYFSGAATVTYLDMLGVVDTYRNISLNRTSESVLQFSIGFPKDASVEVNVTAVSSVRLISAITSQVYDATSGQLEMTIFTSVQAPFKFQSISGTSQPVNISYVSTTLQTDCADSESGPCNQIWNVVLSRTGNNCVFSGSYGIQFQGVCQPSVSQQDCAIVGTDPISISLTVTSDNVCGSLQDEAHITPALATYGSYDSQSHTFSTSKGTFFSNQAVYFKLTLTSDGPAISSTTIEQVTATANDSSIVSLVSNEIPAGVGNYHSALSSASSTQRIHELDFTFNQAWFGNIPTDSSVMSTVAITVSVVFSDTQQSSRRHVIRAGVQRDTNSNSDLGTSAILEIKAESDSSSTTSATTGLLGGSSSDQASSSFATVSSSPSSFLWIAACLLALKLNF